MIIGVGVDIVEVSRIQKNLDKIRFMDKVYTINEQDYINKRKLSPQTAAGIFASKEAVSKAFGTGIVGFALTDIEIIKDEMDKPVVVLHNNAKIVANEKGISNINLSISHEKLYAVAFAVAEKY